MAPPPVYVKLVKSRAGPKVAKGYEKAVVAGATKGLEKFLKGASKDGFSPKPGKDKKKGFALWVVVDELTVDASFQLACKITIHIAHLPSEVKAKAQVTGGGNYQSTEKGAQADAAFLLENVVPPSAKGKVLTYMKKNKP